jgi:hypothetical protein
MNKFDGNLAWKQASAAVATNRDLLLALAGVLFFLPSFALIMLFKQPQMPANATAEQMLPVVRGFLTTMAPWFLIGSVVQALGQLALVELLGRGGRPTVGEALRRGLASLPSFIAVQLIIGFLMMAVLALAMTLGSLVAPVVGVALGLYLVIQAFARLVTASAVIVLERRLNPFAALMRAVLLSRGNGFRIGNFLFLLAAAAAIVLMVLSVVIGILAALTIGEGRVAEIVTGFVSSAASAVALTYFVAIVVAMHRQLTVANAARLPGAEGAE